VCSTVTSPFIAYGLEHQPSPRGWAESIPQYMGRVRPSPEWLGQSGSVFLKKTSKIFFGILQFSRIFYVILINIKQYFHVAKNTTFGIKIPGFCKKKSMFLFSCIRPNLSKLKNSYSIFIQ